MSVESKLSVIEGVIFHFYFLFYRNSFIDTSNTNSVSSSYSTLHSHHRDITHNEEELGRNQESSGLCMKSSKGPLDGPITKGGNPGK